MIKRLRLQNWRSHSDTDFTFSSGVNALLGIMGSGKSSVMDALCFALFGTFPALSQRKLKLDEIIRSRPEQQSSASVEIEFQARNNETYTVFRSIELGKGTKKVELRQGTELVESTNSQNVTSQVEKLLKINYDVFSRAIYSEQNELDQFLNIPKGQRMVRMDALLKIDRFETARKTAGKLLNKFSDELSSKELLSQDILVAEELNSMVQLEKEKRQLEEGMRGLSEQQKNSESIFIKLEQDLKLLEEKVSKLNNLKVQREGLKAQLGGARERFSEFNLDSRLTPELVSAEQSKLTEALTALNLQKKKIDELGREKAGLKSTEEVLDNEISNAKLLLSKLPVANIPVSEILEKKEQVFPKSEEEKQAETDLTALKQTYSDKQGIIDQVESLEFRSVECQKKLEVASTRRKQSKDILDNLHEHDSCPLCENDLTGDKKNELLQKHTTIVQQINQEQTSLNMMVVQAKEKREDLKDIIEKWDGLEKTLEKIHQDKSNLIEKVLDIAQRVSDIEKKKEEVLSKLKFATDNIDKLSQEYSDEKLDKLKERQVGLENAEKAFNLKDKIIGFTKELSVLEEQIISFGLNERELQDIREKHSQALTENEKQKAQLASAQALLNEKNKRFEELNRKRELAEKYKKDIDGLRKSSESLGLLQTALKRTQESLRAEFIESVNQIMGDVWQNLYPYDDLSGVKLIVDAGDYVLSVHTSQGWVNVEGRVSGGERSLACLALRIAFSLALAPNLSWLVLDEPTHNLDTASIDLLGETLRDRLPGLIEQIFLITHEERLESAVSGNLYKLERNKELDEATRVVS
jgi:exonuclease SbcC